MNPCALRGIGGRFILMVWVLRSFYILTRENISILKGGGNENRDYNTGG